MASICIFAPNLFHALETIGFYFDTCGSDVLFATRQDGDERSEHPQSLLRVRQTQKVRLITDKPSNFDLLIADAFVDLKYVDELSRWAARANQLAFLFPHDGTTIKRRAGHLLRYWPHSVKARTAVFVGDRRLTFDTVPPVFQRRVFYPPYVDPRFLNEQLLPPVLSDVSICEHRQYSIGFIGNRSPPERERILAQCRQAVDLRDPRVLWMEYGINEPQKVLPPNQYIETLERMDFSLCPAGWGGNWTHRAVESLCRGAIPILPDAHLYGLGLQDSETCLTVRGTDWNGAISRALQLPKNKIREMRAKILSLRDNLLPPSAISRRFCEQFRIEQ